jgi:repressor LexA
MSTAKKTNLTRRQREIYEFLKDKILNRGYGPTVREIGQQFGIRSPNGVMCHLRALERKGLITRQQNMSRAIQLSELLTNRLSVPLIGTAATSGAPLQPAPAADSSVSFEAALGGSEGRCIRIECNSFISLNILNGDTLIVNQDLPLAPGCHVAALDDRHSLVICTVSETTGQLASLIPGTWVPSSRQVLGVITGMVRQFRLPPPPPAPITEATQEFLDAEYSGANSHGLS